MIPQVIGERPDLSFLDSMYRKACLKTRGVGSVGSIQFEFDNVNRRVYPKLSVKTVDGEDVPDPGPFTIPLGSADL